LDKIFGEKSGNEKKKKIEQEIGERKKLKKVRENVRKSLKIIDKSLIKQR